jgi:hypothetical protein
MSALAAFTRELVRVTWPIAALGLFALLFAPARTDERPAAPPWESASVRCDARPDLVAMGGSAVPNAVQTVYEAGRN